MGCAVVSVSVANVSVLFAEVSAPDLRVSAPDPWMSVGRASVSDPDLRMSGTFASVSVTFGGVPLFGVCGALAAESPDSGTKVFRRTGDLNSLCKVHDPSGCTLRISCYIPPLGAAQLGLSRKDEDVRSDMDYKTMKFRFKLMALSFLVSGLAQAYSFSSIKRVPFARPETCPSTSRLVVWTIAKQLGYNPPLCPPITTQAPDRELPPAAKVQ